MLAQSIMEKHSLDHASLHALGSPRCLKIKLFKLALHEEFLYETCGKMNTGILVISPCFLTLVLKPALLPLGRELNT